MYQEEMNHELQKEGQALRVNFKELDDLNELIGRVQSWKDGVKRFLQLKSVQKQIRRKEKFRNYLNEAKLLKLNSNITLLTELQDQYEFIEWKGQINALWDKVGLQSSLIKDEESLRSDSSYETDKNESSEQSKDKKQQVKSPRFQKELQTVIIQD